MTPRVSSRERFPYVSTNSFAAPLACNNRLQLRGRPVLRLNLDLWLLSIGRLDWKFQCSMEPMG